MVQCYKEVIFMSDELFKTKELIDSYLKTKTQNMIIKTRHQLDRPELYEYEKEINKPLYYMTVDEIIELLKRLTNANVKNRTKLSFRTYEAIITNLKGFFDWYIENVEVVKNPCNNKRLRGSNIAYELVDKEVLLTKEHINSAIEKIHNDRDDYSADYFEAIILLFYVGFPTSLDIVNCKMSDIDHQNKTAVVNGTTIDLGDRLYELLIKLYNIEEIPFAKGTYLFLSYHDSIFKFTTFKSRFDVFQERSAEYYANHLSRTFVTQIRPYFDIVVNARMIYICGFYNWLIAKVGKERLKELVAVDRNIKNTKELMELSNEYGIREKNTTFVKKVLRPYTLE